MDSQVAIITGGGKGLGAAMAAGLASAGANLVLLGRDLPAAEAVASQLAAEYKIEAIALSADVTNLQTVQEAVKAVKERWGRIES